MRRKFILLCLKYPNLKCLLLRRTLPELRENHQLPLQRELYGFVKYNSDEKSFTFPNGSRIRLGYCDTEADVYQYQGQEYDVIGLEEATHFCVHPDTEVMTDSGWKKIENVRKTDLVYSVNKNHIGEYKSISDIYAFQHNGEMLEYKSENGMRFNVTPTHKFIDKDKWLKPIEEFKSNHKVLINTTTRVEPDEVEWFMDLPPHQHGCSNEAEKIKMDTWLQFLGWYYSEGCAFTRDGKSPRICIRQMTDNDNLIQTMNDMPYKNVTSKDGHYMIYSRQLYEYLKPLGDMYTKRVPRFIYKLNNRQIKLFIKSFEMGDGHVDPRHNTTSIGLCNEGLIDDLQELYTLIGKRPCKSKTITNKGFTVYRLYIGKQNTHSYILPKQLEKYNYEGDVWCLSIEDNHNFMTRYKGKIMFTGNTESQKDFLITCNRSTRTDFKPRMYFTSNPGNVGHAWFKRLFIDREYRNKERPEDYEFIQALVYDNDVLMKTNPEYVTSLENLPEDMKKAMLYGDWNVFEGQFFSEWNSIYHVIKPFNIPTHWRIYRTLDYGLDKCAVYWIAQSPDNKFYVVDELYESDLIVSSASKKILEIDERVLDKTHNPDRTIEIGIAPPDIWSRNQETGKSAADIFHECGVEWAQGNNDRINGWLAVKEMLKLVDEKDPLDETKTVTLSQMRIFDTCTNLIRTLPQLQHDTIKPNDIAKQPHELTHAADAVRMFALYWISGGDVTYVNKPSKPKIKWTEDMYEDYYRGSPYIKERMIEKYGEPN